MVKIYENLSGDSNISQTVGRYLMFKSIKNNNVHVCLFKRVAINSKIIFNHEKRDWLSFQHCHYVVYFIAFFISALINSEFVVIEFLSLQFAKK